MAVSWAEQGPHYSSVPKTLGQDAGEGGGHESMSLASQHIGSKLPEVLTRRETLGRDAVCRGSHGLHCRLSLPSLSFLGLQHSCREWTAS